MRRMPLAHLALWITALALAPAAAAQEASGEALPRVAAQPEPATPEGEASAEADFSAHRGLYALFYTTEGDFACRLFEDLTYLNVRNFVDLACGYRVWRNPRNGEERREPYYDGLPIYHVTRNAMIVGGDPLANGLGSPGYYIEDEIRPDLTFDLPGRLAMANLGGQPNTNSGTWFVTAAPLPELNGRYTIIGEVVQGMDVVRRISRAEADPTGRPRREILVRRIDIIRVLKNGDVVAHLRSTARPYAEVEQIPAFQRGSDLPLWLRERSASEEFRLPPLPPIYD